MTRGWRGRDAWDWAVRVAAGLALVVSFGLGVVQYRYQACKARYDDRAARASAERAEAAERDRLANAAVWRAIGEAFDPAVVPPARAGQHVKAAIQTFNVEREATDRQRSENPPPAPPSQVCR